MGYVADSVYWIGQDGNVYLKGPSGTVQNAGKPINVGDSGFDSNMLSAAATRIDDPNPGNGSPAAPADPNGSVAAAAAASTPAPIKVDKSNDIALQNAGLTAADTQQTTGIAAIDKALGGLTDQYGTEATANEANYGTQSDTNKNNLQKNKQSAMVNAAMGRRGLFGTLQSIGALNGSGIDLANRAVQTGANEDLAGAADNFSTNQTSLDTGIGTFREEDKRRRENAATAAENAKTNVKNDTAKSKQTLYSNLANDYAAQGDAENAKKFTDMAAALYPEVAKTSVPSSDLAYTGAAFTPGTLANYIAGANDTTVSIAPSPGGRALPGLFATNTKKKQLQLA